MPAFLSHYILAQRILRKIPEEYEVVYKNAFFWGATGPDFFYGHRLLPWQYRKSLSEISHIIHDSPPEKILDYLYSYSVEKEDRELRDYAFGFVTHYAFDSVAHPYVLYRANRGAEEEIIDIPLITDIKKSSIYHNRMEACLDSVFLKKETGMSVGQIRLEVTCPNDGKCIRKIAGAMDSYIRDSGIWPWADPEEIERAVYDWRRCIILLNDRYHLKKYALSYGEKILGFPQLVSFFFRSSNVEPGADYANFRRREWISPADGSVHRETFFELADRAEEKALALIRKLHETGHLSYNDCKESFSGNPLSLS